MAALEVTAAQFTILANVLKGHATISAWCELCNFMDYDRGAMSRMIDRLESKGLKLRRVPLAHTRRMMGLEVTAEGKAAFSEDAGLPRPGAEPPVERRLEDASARNGEDIEADARQQLIFLE